MATKRKEQDEPMDAQGDQVQAEAQQEPVEDAGEQDLFASLIEEDERIEREAQQKRDNIKKKLEAAVGPRLEAIKNDLQRIVKLTNRDIYDMLGLEKPKAERQARTPRAATGETTATGRAKRGTAQGQAKPGVIYKCPEGFIDTSKGLEWPDADETWQTGARGVRNPKPEWLEAWLKDGNRWADLPQEPAMSAPGEVTPND